MEPRGAHVSHLEDVCLVCRAFQDDRAGPRVGRRYPGRAGKAFREGDSRLSRGKSPAGPRIRATTGRRLAAFPRGVHGPRSLPGAGAGDRLSAGWWPLRGCSTRRAVRTRLPARPPRSQSGWPLPGHRHWVVMSPRARGCDPGRFHRQSHIVDLVVARLVSLRIWAVFRSRLHPRPCLPVRKARPNGDFRSSYRGWLVCDSCSLQTRFRMVPPGWPLRLRARPLLLIPIRARRPLLFIGLGTVGGFRGSDRLDQKTPRAAQPRPALPCGEASPPTALRRGPRPGRRFPSPVPR